MAMKTPSNNTHTPVDTSVLPPVSEENGNPNRPSSVSRIHFNNLSQVNADISLARTPQVQKADALMHESVDKEEKDTNQDEDVEETVVSDDDVIDYSVKPEFYDPNLDDKDEKWIKKKRKGQYSDAVLSCPACFTTLCLECQRHEKYVTQYRAVFVVNCKIKKGQVSDKGSLKRKRVKKGGGDDESFSPVCCGVCETEVGVVDDDEVYHFFNVLPSEC